MPWRFSALRKNKKILLVNESVHSHIACMSNALANQLSKRSKELFGMKGANATPAFEVVRNVETKLTLPIPRKLTCHEVTEVNGTFRPVVEARVTRGFWVWKRFEDVSFYGGSWISRAAARVVTREE